MRFLLILLAVFSAGLGAQATVTTGAVTFQNANQLSDWYFEIDFGPNPQNVVLTAGLEATTSAGIEVEIWMIDKITVSASATQARDHRMLISLPSAASASSIIWGAGAPDGFPSGPFSMSGVHRFQFTMAPANAGGVFPVNLTATFETNAGSVIPPSGTTAPGSSGVTIHAWSQTSGATPGMTPGTSLVGSSDCYQRNQSGTAWGLVRFGDAGDEPCFFIDVDHAVGPGPVSLRVYAQTSSGSGAATAELYNLAKGWETPIISLTADTALPGSANSSFATNHGDQSGALTRYRLVFKGQNLTVSPGTFADFRYEICFGRQANVLDVVREPEQAPAPMSISPGTTQLTTTTTLTASGGSAPANYIWALVAPVPTGLSLSSASGTSVDLQVDVSAPPDFTVQVRCSNGLTGERVVRTYGPVQVAWPPSLPGGTVGLAWPGRTFEAAGGEGPYSWSATGLPPGLSLDAVSGRLTGTPTSAGSFANVEVFVTDDNSVTASRIFQVQIGAAPPLAVANVALPDGTRGTPYNARVYAAGGVAPYDWSISVGNLPPGLTLGVSGAITGTPSAAGSFTFTVQLEDAEASVAQRVFTITVAAPRTGSGGSGGSGCAGARSSNLPALLLILPAAGIIRSRRLRSARG